MSNLLPSPNWQSSQIETSLWQRAQTRLGELEQSGEEALVRWDESVREKPESIQLEGLCAVRASKARRDPPHQTRRLQSTGRASYVCSRHALARDPRAWQKWSSHLGSDEVVDNAGRTGFGGGDDRWRRACWMPASRHGNAACFILRWHKGSHLRDADGRKRSPGRIRGKRRAFGERQVWDGRRRQWVQGGVVAIPVTHPDYEQQLWLVGSRPGKGRPPWERAHD